MNFFNTGRANELLRTLGIHLESVAITERKEEGKLRNEVKCKTQSKIEK